MALALLDDSIQEILLAEPGDTLWTRVANGGSVANIIDLGALIELIKEEHEEYCEKHGLCTSCLAKLTPLYVKDGAWGRLETIIEDYVCPNGHS